MRQRPNEPATREAGSATLEGAVLFPALLLVIVTALQLALFFYARNLALAAAQEGVRAARAYDASMSVGVSAARDFLDQAAGGTLTAVTVSSSGSGPTQIRIEVRGRSLSLLPGSNGFAVSQQAHGPVERFTTPGET